MSEYGDTPEYDEGLPATTAQPPPPAYSLEIEAILNEFAARFQHRSRFNLTFSAVGVAQLFAFIENNHLSPNPHALAVNTMARTFYAVVALMEVEWRSSHCTPYNASEITFQLTQPRTTAIFWLQHFDIVVEATSLQRLDRPRRRDSVTIGGLIGLTNLGRSTDLPPFPLSESRRALSSSGVQADTGIDSSLSTWDYDRLYETSHPPEHPLWIDRFTAATGGSTRVWWQWSGVRSALYRVRGRDTLFAGDAYAAEFTRMHVVGEARYPTSRTSPALLIVFMGPRQLRPQARSTTVGSTSSNAGEGSSRRRRG
ncbi:hypothetical protein JCM6882_009019 [Rhodosporidiobolus microsporus]